MGSGELKAKRYLHQIMSVVLVSGVLFCSFIFDSQMISELLYDFWAYKDSVLMTDTSPPFPITSLVLVLVRSLFLIFHLMIAAGLVGVD